MYALTIRRPWLDLILDGDKRLENRSWLPKRLEPLPGWLALHCATRPDETFGMYERAGLLHAGAVPGHVVALARVVSAGPAAQYDDDPHAWGPLCWELDPVVLLPTPLACRGQQGLWALPHVVEGRLDAFAPTRVARPSPSPTDGWKREFLGRFDAGGAP